MKTIRMVKPVSVGLLTIVAFCFTPAITARGGTTYLFVGADSRGNYQDVKNWQDADGNNPTYAPTDANCNPDDTYVVKDGKRTRDEGAGYANMQIYGRVVYGEIGGTAGYHTEESQYPRSWGAKIDFCHPDGVTFANGAYTANNSATSEEWGNRVMGKITITAPATAPFVFTTSNSTDGRYIYFENTFASSESAGMKFDDSGRGNWQFKGSLSDYRGSMSFAKPGSTVLFGADTGTVAMDALSFASSMTVTVENVSAPIKAKTLTLAGGDAFRLSASTDGTTLSYAALVCETFVRSGSDKISIVLANFGDLRPTATTTIKIALLTAENGGLNADDFDVDLSGKEARAEFKGVAVEDGEGDSQTLVATFDYAGVYYFVGADSRGNYNDVKNWRDAGGNNPTYAPTDANCNPDDTYVVKDGKRTRDLGAGPSAMDIYGRMIYGEVGGTVGNHYEESQYPRSNGAHLNFLHQDGATFANGTYTAGNGTVDSTWGNRVMGKIKITAPATAPFVFTTSNSTDGRYIYFENSFESLESAGMMFDDSGRGNWQFKGSLSDYRGSMSFAKPGSTALFGTDSGTIDLDALSFAASMTVTVENVSAPLKAKTLTLGDGTVFNLSAGTEGDDLSVASLEAESLALEGAITLRIASMPRIPCGVSEVRLVTVKQGTLDVSKFSLDIAGSGARHCKGLRVDETEEGTALVAVFEHPGLMLLVK